MKRRTKPVLYPVTQLEDRVTPAINFLFDFRFDDSGFFTDNPDRITTLRAAATDVGNRFSDTLTAIPFPDKPTDSWKAKFNRPSGVGQAEEVTNLYVPENTLVVFVGARDLISGEDLTEESSSGEVYGSPEWFDKVNGRGQPNSYGAAAIDYSPWGGSITFDKINNWHYNLDPPGNPDEYDLYMATQKALFHLMGFGTSDIWKKFGSTGYFMGPKSVAVTGLNIPLTSGNYEWREDTLSRGQRTLMDADLENGERILPTDLDIAAMQDIGWTLQSGKPPEPPAAPPPPKAPPGRIPAGTRLHVVGSGEGMTATFTVNDASSFTQLASFTPYTNFGSGTAFSGGIRGVTADLNKDGIEDIITGPGPGISTEIRVYNGANFPISPDTSLFASGYAFETSFTGGVFLSAGDINNDGYPDVIVSPDNGGGPRVRIVSGKDRSMIADFFGIDDTNFRGGARTAVGDMNKDGVPDLIVAAGFGGGPRVAIFDGKTIKPGSTPQKLTSDFFVFEPELRNGAYVAVGDLNGDGYGDLISGAGPGGGPRVYALSGFGLIQEKGKFTELANFFAGDPNTRGGVPVAVKNIDGDRRADILTGVGSGAQSVVTTYVGSSITNPSKTPPVYQQHLVFDASFQGGVFVG